MFTVSNQNNVDCILNNWCICINISCGPRLGLARKVYVHTRCHTHVRVHYLYVFVFTRIYIDVRICVHVHMRAWKHLQMHMPCI